MDCPPTHYTPILGRVKGAHVVPYGTMEFLILENHWIPMEHIRLITINPFAGQEVTVILKDGVQVTVAGSALFEPIHSEDMSCQ